MFDSASFDTQSFSTVSFEFDLDAVNPHIIAPFERLVIDQSENRIYHDE